MASEAEALLAWQLDAVGIAYVREHKFHPTRQWRVDFAWPEHKLALECEGAVYAQGRHTRGPGFVADCEKYNELAIAGWRLLRVIPQHIQSGEALRLIERALGRADAPADHCVQEGTR